MKILAVGRNYLAHAVELGNSIPEDPIIFIKPKTALTTNNQAITIPEFTNNLHYELEVTIKFLEPVNVYTVLDEIEIEVGLGLDLTARDLQNTLKEKGLPWELAKGFNGSAVISDPLTTIKISDFNNFTFQLFVNDAKVQNGNTDKMLFSLPKLIGFITRFFNIEKGDYLMTGTPEGVGKIQSGQLLKGFLNNTLLLNVKVN